MFKFVQRVSAVKNDTYQLELDEYRDGEDQLLLVHFRVQKFTLSVLKRMQSEWQLWRSLICTSTLYATGEVDDAKWRRFVTLFGFQPLMPVMTECGQPRSLYVHYGNFDTNNPIKQPKLPLGATAELSAPGVSGR